MANRPFETGPSDDDHALRAPPIPADDPASSGSLMDDLSGGWVALWRKSLDNWIFDDANMWKLWTWCLLRARWQPGDVSVTTGRGSTVVHLEPGQFIFGRHAAARALKASGSGTWKRLLRLKTCGNLDIQPDTHFSIITICNWERYQNIYAHLGQANGQAKDTQRTPKGHKEQG